MPIAFSPQNSKNKNQAQERVASLALLTAQSAGTLLTAARRFPAALHESMRTLGSASLWMTVARLEVRRREREREEVIVRSRGVVFGEE